MSTVLITCNGYTVIREVGLDATDLPELCRAAEVKQNDGFAVVASRDGRMVADAEGWIRSSPMSAYERAESSFGEIP